VNQAQWATLSDTSFTVAVALYSVAVLAFCAELAFGTARQAAPAERELVAAGGAGTPTRARPR
jgi:hypothetical protein